MVSSKTSSDMLIWKLSFASIGNRIIWTCFVLPWHGNYVNQKQFLYTSSPRSLHKDFHLSCMDFQYHQFFILHVLCSLLQQRRMFEFMICWNTSWLRNLRRDSVKFHQLQFILLVYSYSRSLIFTPCIIIIIFLFSTCLASEVGIWCKW